MAKNKTYAIKFAGKTVRAFIHEIPPCECGHCPRTMCDRKKCDKEAVYEVTMPSIDGYLRACTEHIKKLAPEFVPKLQQPIRINSSIRGIA